LTVIFLTFWQGLVISMCPIKDPEDGKALQNFMICIEMAISAFTMQFAFPVADFKIGGSAAGLHVGAMVHAISIRDVLADVLHQFAGTYHEYVLYSDGGPADNTKRNQFRGADKGQEKERAKALRKLDGGVMGSIGLAAVEEKLGGERRKKKKGGEESHIDERDKRMAILLDSDSDAVDSDDEGGKMATGLELYSSDEEAGGGGGGGAPSGGGGAPAAAPPGGGGLPRPGSSGNGFNGYSGNSGGGGGGGR